MKTVLQIVVWSGVLSLASMSGWQSRLLLAQMPEMEAEPARKIEPAGVEDAKEHFGEILKNTKLQMELAQSEHLLVYSDLGAQETAAIAELAQKAFQASCRLLEIDQPGTLFESKLTLVVLDNDQHFEPLQKAMFETNLTAGRSVLWRIQGPRPCILVSKLPSQGFRTPGFSANWSQFTSRFIGTTVLLRRYPEDPTHARLPVWIRDGFGLYASLVAQDNPETTKAYRDLFRMRLKDNSEMFNFSLPNEGFYNFHVTSVVEFVLATMEPGQFDALAKALQKQKVVRDKRMSSEILKELRWDQVEMQRHWRYFAKFGNRLAR